MPIDKSAFSYTFYTSSRDSKPVDPMSALPEDMDDLNPTSLG